MFGKDAHQAKLDAGIFLVAGFLFFAIPIVVTIVLVRKWRKTPPGRGALPTRNLPPRRR